MEVEKNPAFLKLFFAEEVYLVKDKTAEPKQPMEEVSEPPAPSESTYPITDTRDMRLPLAVLLKQPPRELPPSQQKLLANIIGAVKLTKEEILYLTEEQLNNDPSLLQKAEHILSFNIGVNTSLRSYQITKKGDQQFLLSDSLAALEQATALKGKLWNALKEMFAIR